MLIEYLGISTTKLVSSTIAWQDKRDCGSKPHALSNKSSSVSSASFNEAKPSRTIT